MHFIKPTDRNQAVIFGSLDNLVSRENPVRIIDAIISSIVQNNPKEFEYKGKRNVGRRAYSPEAMLKLFIYGYLNGISSSRKLEVETHRNIEVKWLLGDLQPDHKTIANYRKENERHIRFITIEFRKFLKSHGYVKGKKVAVDGTKVKANTNRDMLSVKKIEERMSRLDWELEKYLKKLEISDSEEDVLDEIENSDTDSKNKELIQEIASLRLEIEKLKKTKDTIIKSGKKLISFSDPNANLMKSRNGYVPDYNVQIAVDAENHMIAEGQVSTSENDKNELVPMIKSLKENIEIEPEELLADKGYYNLTAIKMVEDERKTKCFIPGERVNNEIQFTYDRDKDVYICPLEKELKFKQNIHINGQKFRQYRGKDCEGCPIRSKCTKSKSGRSVYRHQYQDWRNDYKIRIKHEDSKRKICDRKAIVEHAFGTIKYWMGQIPLLLRGKIKVQTEINIYTTAYNLKRLMNIESFGDLIKKISEYEWKIDKKEKCCRTTPILHSVCSFIEAILLVFYTKVFFRENISMLKIEV